jgi:integrase
MAIKKQIDTNNKILYEVYVHGHDPRGKRVQWRRCGIKTLKRAEVVEFELKRKLAQVKESKVDVRFHEWITECLSIMKLSYRPSTLYSYETTINKWLMKAWQDTDLKTINKQSMYSLLFVDLPDKTTVHTRKYVLKIIKRIFQMAVDQGHLDRNPAQGLTIKVPEANKTVLTSSEVKTLLTEAKLTNHRFYPIWVMALFTGMRSGELYALTWSDVDLENKIIHVSRSWSSKNGYTSTKNQKSRVVPISPDLLQFLKAWKLSQGHNNGEFVSTHLQEWTRGSAAEVLRHFCKLLNITPIRFHDLRATFITNLLTRGESLARVMAIVGHADIDTTNVYLRLAGVELKGGTDKLDFEIPTETDAAVLRLSSFANRE